MSPPISKDWWVAAAITGAALPAAIGQTPPTSRQPAGIVTGAQAGQPASVQPLYMDGANGQRVVTGPGQTVHVLFPDQSALTVGPNSEVTIARMEYDPRSKNGNIVIDMTKGLLRVVGGFISKRSEVQVRTATATVGIRGGITVVETDGQGATGSFLFGQSMRMTSNNGSQTVTRPGFQVTYTNNRVSTPNRFDPNLVLGGFNGQTRGGNNSGQNGGTLPGGNTNLAPDRLANRGNPNPDNGNGDNEALTLRDILGGHPGPGNQS
jgi:hypothetical protein